MKTSPPPQHRQQAGFTLIELSIVLVIIGLIAGGVLVGQDMIKAAEIRSQVAQISGYDQAFNAFRVKYNALPGDISGGGGNFGLQNTGSPATPTLGLGDGNGLIQTGSAATSAASYLGEPAMAFTHLSQAGLIKDGIANGTYAIATAITISNTTMPAAKMGRGNRMYVVASGGLNYYAIGGFSGAAAATTGAMTSADAMTPNEAFQIDSKMDDGAPDAGLVRPITVAGTPLSIEAFGDATPTDAGASAPIAGTCYDSDAPRIYATVGTVSRDVVGCQLRIRSQF